MIKRFFLLFCLSAALVGTLSSASAYDPIPGCFPCSSATDTIRG